MVNELYENQYDKIFDVAKVKCEYDSLVANIYDESDEMVRYKCDWDEDKRITGRYVAFSKKMVQDFIGIYSLIHKFN